MAFVTQNLFAVFAASDVKDSEQSRHAAAARVQLALSEYAGEDVTVGVGGTAESLCRVPALWRRAREVLRWGEVFIGKGSVVKYDMMGALGALMDNEPAPAPLQEYVSLRLGPLLENDLREGTDLYHTLTVFVECGGNRVETARRIFVHYNTLRQRLQRIEELVGTDLSHPVSSLDISLCVHIASMYPITP
jgi:purine catabolism regulator